MPETESKREGAAFGSGFIGGCVVASIIMGAIGIYVLAAAHDNLRRTFEKEAVLQGHAEYTVDKEGGSVWRWKPVAEKP